MFLRCIFSRRFTTANPVRLIVAGGDGSVMWAMSEVIAHGIDINFVAFGVVPFGTGNDFARSLGWGSSTPSGDIGSNGLRGLKTLISSWLRASVCDFDLWEVSLNVDIANGGYMEQIKSKAKTIVRDSDNITSVISKPMCNYFSIGIESRIGIGFDRNRKHSTMLNKLTYGWEGFKKSFTSTPRIAELIDNVKVNDRVILNTDPTTCKGSPVSLIFSNIDSFAGGCDLWSKSKRLAVQGVAPDAKLAMKALKQSVGDGKLEILTYNSLVGLSAEQLPGALGGNGRRVGQEEGPIKVCFRKELGDKRCYAQIDGEFYLLHKPTHVDIKHIHTVKVLAKSAS